MNACTQRAKGWALTDGPGMDAGQATTMRQLCHAIRAVGSSFGLASPSVLAAHATASCTGVYGLRDVKSDNQKSDREMRLSHLMSHKSGESLPIQDLHLSLRPM